MRKSKANQDDDPEGRASQLSGCAYARFSLPEGASEIIAAFAAPDEESVQSTRSISEHLQQQLGQPEGTSLGRLLRRLPGLREEAQCPSLSLVGTGCSEGICLPAMEGPLRFAWLGSDVCGLHGTTEAVERLHQFLAAAVSWVLEADAGCKEDTVTQSAAAPGESKPPDCGGNSSDGGPTAKSKPGRPEVRVDHISQGGRKYRRRKRKAAPELSEDVDGVSPCILVRGFPDSWTEKEARLTFALCGGVESIKFAGSPGNRVAHAKLKDIKKTTEAVAQLNGMQVGDGILIEKCIISCELGSQKFRSQTPAGTAPATGGGAAWDRPAQFFGPQPVVPPQAAGPPGHWPISPPPGHWSLGAQSQYSYQHPPPGYFSPAPPPPPPRPPAGQLQGSMPPGAVQEGCEGEPTRRRRRRRRRKKEHQSDQDVEASGGPPRGHLRGPFSPRRDSVSSEPVVSSFGLSEGEASPGRERSASPSLLPAQEANITSKDRCQEVEPAQRHSRQVRRKRLPPQLPQTFEEPGPSLHSSDYEPSLSPSPFERRPSPPILERSREGQSRRIRQRGFDEDCRRSSSRSGPRKYFPQWLSEASDSPSPPRRRRTAICLRARADVRAESGSPRRYAPAERSNGKTHKRAR